MSNYDKVPMVSWSKDDYGNEISRVIGYYFRPIAKVSAELTQSIPTDAITAILRRPSNDGGSKVPSVPTPPNRPPRPGIALNRPVPSILRP
jgi:hypothetical protein